MDFSSPKTSLNMVRPSAHHILKLRLIRSTCTPPRRRIVLHGQKTNPSGKSSNFWRTQTRPEFITVIDVSPFHISTETICSETGFDEIAVTAGAYSKNKALMEACEARLVDVRIHKLRANSLFLANQNIVNSLGPIPAPGNLAPRPDQ